MRSILAPVFLALLVPASDAVASSCALGPYVQTLTPSLQCDIVVYRLAGHGVDPQLHVIRDGAWIDVTGDVQKTTAQLPVAFEETGCNGEVVASNTNDVAFDIYRITTSAQLGEQIHFEGMVLNPMTDAACEPVAAPDLACPLTAYPCEEPDLGDDIVVTGCSTTGGSSGSLALLAVLALLSRRSRKIEVTAAETSALQRSRT